MSSSEMSQWVPRKMSKAALPEFKLTEDSKQVIRDILMSKDGGNKGYVTADELAQCLQALGFDASDEDVEFLVKHMDDDGDGTLEIDEVLGNIDVINYHCFYGKELMQEFKNIDRKGKGIIRFPEMLKVLTTRGEHPLEALEARRLLDYLARKFDANFDGKFNYTEFVKIYMSDMLPYKDEIVAGVFKVGEYKNLHEEEKKRPGVKKKAKSSVEPRSEALQRAKDELDARQKAARSVSYDNLPGYMRPKGVKPKTSESAIKASTDAHGHGRAKAPATSVHATSTRTKTPSSAARPRVAPNYDELPGYMRPRTYAIRNHTGSNDDKANPGNKSATQKATVQKPESAKVLKSRMSDRTDYFGYKSTADSPSYDYSKNRSYYYS